MAVKNGYKHTDIGAIPIDWDTKKLSQLGKFSKGQGVRKDEALSGHIACVRYGELYTRHNDYIKEFYSFISKEVSLTSKRLKEGDILFAGSGETKEEIGKSVAFINHFEAYAGGDIVILSPLNCSSLYLGYLLNAPLIQKQKASRGQGDAVVHISASQLGSITIPLPPTISEQTAIATALSDADALISSLEKLIDKKRNIKQGVMQQLLQPKEDWKVIKLGDIASFFKGRGLPKNDIVNDGKIKCIHYGELFTLYPESITTIYSSTNTYNNAFYSKSNDVLMPTSDVTPNGLATASCINQDNILLGGDIMVIRIDPNILNGVFLSYYITQNREKVMKLVSGSTVYHLYGSNMKGFEVIYPAINAQRQAVGILTDIDRQIVILEAKLEKYKQIKKGMMQQLLTGKIRLV